MAVVLGRAAVAAGIAYTRYMVVSCGRLQWYSIRLTWLRALPSTHGGANEGLIEVVYYCKVGVASDMYAFIQCTLRYDAMHAESLREVQVCKGTAQNGGEWKAVSVWGDSPGRMSGW